MTLRETIQKMEDEIIDEYEMGTDDARDLFQAIWHQMTVDAKGPVNSAINTVEEFFKIKSE